MVDYVVSLIITIIGGVTCHYVIKWLDSGSIINVGVTPLRCHFQHYFFQKISIQDSHTLQ